MTTKTTATIFSFPPRHSPSTITPNYVQEPMTAKATRQGYATDVIEAKSIYLRRAHPKDPVELVIAPGNHDCWIVRLSPQQHEALTRDSHDLWFKKTVLA